jgi:cell division protein FtsQ
VSTGEPTFGFSLDAVRRRVEQLGPVQTATVERELPGTLVVSIVERNAFAIWQTGGTDGQPPSFALIDKQGNVITNQNAIAAKRREPWLLLLVGTDAPQNAQSLMAELRGAPSVLSHVVAAERVDGLRWNLVLKDRTVVKLPDVGEAEAIDQLAALQASIQLLERPVQVIDLRIPGRLVVKPYPTPKPDSGKSRHT